VGATGTTTLDFGAFPGKGEASVAIVGQAGIVSGSFLEAWIRPADTADHTADEHYADPPRVVAGDIVAGTGFTIRAFMRDPTTATPDAYVSTRAPGERAQSAGQPAPMPYGLWTVAWVWN
jgi:hypothetical protein